MNNKRLFLTSLIIALIFIGILVALTILEPIFIGKIHQDAPNPSLLATAESLVNIPSIVELPEISIELGLQVYASSPDTDTTICIDAGSASLTQEELQRFEASSQLYVNGDWVIGAHHRELGTDLLMPSIQWCAYGKLNQGLHLIEFHLRDSSGETLHIQQWAIEVE